MNFSKIFKFFLIAVFFIGLILPLFVFAAEQPCKDPPKEPVKFFPQITIPGTKIFDKTKSEGKNPEGITIDCNSIALLAADVYKFIAGIAGIAAVIVMMAGGYIWLFAGGNASKVGEAKSLITSAVLGLFLVLGSYMILNLINPRLVELRSLKVKPIKSISVSGNGSTTNDINAAKYPCPMNEEIKAREKTKVIDGCGKLISTEETAGTSCMRVSCPAGQVCVLNESGGDFLTAGSGCRSEITVIAKDGEPKIFSTKNDTVAACGYIGADNASVYSNNCGGDPKYTSCTLTRINEEDPEVDASGDHWYDVFLAEQKNVMNMECKGDL